LCYSFDAFVGVFTNREISGFSAFVGVFTNKDFNGIIFSVL
jgi:hypothetical protein